MPTPDIEFLGKVWEIKSPEGKTARTIANIMRRAARQSKNLILDLRFVQVEERLCLKTIAKNAPLYHFDNVVAVTKEKKVLAVYGKSGMIMV